MFTTSGISLSLAFDSTEAGLEATIRGATAEDTIVAEVAADTEKEVYRHVSILLPQIYHSLLETR